MPYFIYTVFMLSSLSSAFSIPFLRSPRLPNFIEHSPHAVQSIGSAQGDIRSQICNYDLHSQSNPASGNNTIDIMDELHDSAFHGQKLNVPDILSDIVVNSNIHHGGWGYGMRGIVEMERCPPVFSYIRSFEFYIYAENSPPSLLAPRLALLLEGMVQLEKLHIVIPEDYTESFETEFRKINLRLPHVESLIVGPFMEWMVDLCPNAKTLTTSSWWLHARRGDSVVRREHSMRLIEAASNLKRLERFEMKEWWSIELLEAVHKNLPNIPTLAMPGGTYDESIVKMLPTLSLFAHLESLELESADALRVGFNPPSCGNIYMGKDGEAIRKRVQAQGKAACDRVVKTVGSALQGLKVLSIGRRTVDIVRSRENIFVGGRYRCAAEGKDWVAASQHPEKLEDYWREMELDMEL